MYRAVLSVRLKLCLLAAAWGTTIAAVCSALAGKLPPAGLLAVGLACAGVGGLVVWAGASRWLAPLRALREGVERLAAGDLEARVAPVADDELGLLARRFNEMGDSLRQKSGMQQAFRRYTSDYVVERLLAEGGAAQLAGAEREVTILFADVRAFTRLSEGLPPAEVVALLNEVFQLASDCILARSGCIDKFMGDAVMAWFGVSATDDDHALHAVEAGLDLCRALEERRARLAGSGVAALMGIGIHTGNVVVGNIGSERRTDFTAVGDPVNVAQRLEKLAGGGQVVVSEAVQRRVRHRIALDFSGAQKLPGREAPVHVYTVRRPGLAGAAR